MIEIHADRTGRSEGMVGTPYYVEGVGGSGIPMVRLMTSHDKPCVLGNDAFSCIYKITVRGSKY